MAAPHAPQPYNPDASSSRVGLSRSARCRPLSVHPSGCCGRRSCAASPISFTTAATSSAQVHVRDTGAAGRAAAPRARGCAYPSRALRRRTGSRGGRAAPAAHRDDASDGAGTAKPRTTPRTTPRRQRDNAGTATPRRRQRRRRHRKTANDAANDTATTARQRRHRDTATTPRRRRHRDTAPTPRTTPQQRRRPRSVTTSSISRLAELLRLQAAPLSQPLGMSPGTRSTDTDSGPVDTGNRKNLSKHSIQTPGAHSGHFWSCAQAAHTKSTVQE